MTITLKTNRISMFGYSMYGTVLPRSNTVTDLNVIFYSKLSLLTKSVGLLHICNNTAKLNGTGYWSTNT